MKISILGFGRWAQIIYDELFKINDYQIVAVCDRNSDKLVNVDPNIRKFSNIKDFLQSETDLVFICTQPRYHFEHIDMCFDKNLDVLCEKPLTSDSRSSYKIIQRSVENSCKLYVTNQYCFSSEVKMISNILQNEEIKKYSSQRFNMSSYGDDNVVRNLTYHDLCIFEFLTKKLDILELTIGTLRKQYDGLVECKLISDDGNHQFHSSHVAKTKTRLTQIITDNHTITWDECQPIGRRIYDHDIQKYIEIPHNESSVRLRLKNIAELYQQNREDDSNHMSFQILEKIDKVFNEQI